MADGDQSRAPAGGYQVQLPRNRRIRAVAARIDHLVGGLARHWLAVFNLGVGVFFILPFLAPVFMHLGWTSAGHLIYVVYSPTCHQLPERSYFLFGPDPVLSVAQLEQLGAVPAGLSIFQRELLRWPGSPAIGYKVAFCERDAAIYGSILLAGLAFAQMRGRWLAGGRRVPKLPIWVYALFLVPMAVDGFTQLFGWRESNWWLRTITGVLFGVATVWLAYPYVQDAMDDVVNQPPGIGQSRPAAV